MDNDTFQLLVLALWNQRRQQFIYSRNRKRFYKDLCRRRQRLRDRRIPRASLHFPTLSSWRELFFSRNDQALVTLTGFDHRTFAWLLHMFEPVYLRYSPGVKTVNGYMVRIRHPNHGHPRLMTEANCLGLNLAWTGLRGSMQRLQMIFGLTGTRVSTWLRFGRRLLIMILSGHSDAAVQIPSAARIRQYKAAMKARHPSLTDVWCTMDGLKLSLQQSTNSNIQSFFNAGPMTIMSHQFSFLPLWKYPNCWHQLLWLFP